MNLIFLKLKLLSALEKVKLFLQPYWEWIYIALGLFLFFKVFKIHQKLRKRFHDYWEDLFLSKIEYSLLEVKIPDALEKTPLGIEQFFAGLHGTAKGVTAFEREVKGYLETSYSLEVVSIGGKIHFYIRCERQYRTTVEALIYAQFPTVEIQEVEDYTQNAPQNLPNNKYDLVGAELILEKPDPYPIKTYQQFEMQAGKESEYLVDPFAGVMEALSSIGEGEQIWLHYIIGLPMFGDWRKEGQALIDSFMGRQAPPKAPGLIKTFIREIFAFYPYIRNRLIHLIKGGEYQEPSEPSLEEKQQSMDLGLWRLSPGEREVVLAVEKNIAKLGFYTVIRFVYFAPKEIFQASKASALAGAFLQFNDKNLNGFKSNPKLGYKVRTPDLWRYRIVNYALAWKHKEIPWTIQKLRELRMKEIYKNCLTRAFGRPQRGHKGFIFNTEELATVFHFPMKSVLTPELPKVEAKRGGPPARLPME